MLDEIRKSINSTLYERVSSPLYGAAIVSWLIWNWEIVYLTLFIDESGIAGTKIDYILANYSSIHSLLTYPAISTLMLLTVIPFISNGAYYLNLIFRKWRIDKKNEVENKQLLSIEKSIELRTEIRSQEEKFEKLLDGKNEEIRILTQEVEAYRAASKEDAETSEALGSISKEPEEAALAADEQSNARRNINSDSEYPPVMNIVMRQLPRSESEWLIVYSFYASKFGNKPFTKKELSEMYDATNRKTPSRIKNISNNLKTLFRNNYITALNSNEMIFSSTGKEVATEIITRTGSTSRQQSKEPLKPAVKTKRESKKKSSAKSLSFKLDRSLNLRPSAKESLREYASKYKLRSNPERILIIVFYLRETLKMDGINANHIYTGFEALNFRVPKSLYQLISDTKNKKGWLDFENMEDIRLSIQGRNHIKYDLEKA